MSAFTGWQMGWVLSLLLPVLLQSACGQVERDALAEEQPLVSHETADRTSCELGSLRSVSGCAAAGSCHVCARLEVTAGGVCVQACAVGSDECPSGQACHPVAELRDAGGYARIGDCPSGYCR